ncbi:ferredoxin--NADP reductase [Haloechinothrix sp. LS1_15]|uniref:ferredoxin--NADP reductase n=1 Tax=Haloechinothrix sp. LS1_15 TaxID=2652248 RepID=UPI002947A74B|nr:ferredoxin--NADP reductase [Haloechinothrix sp. LS1_15]MDV6014112.1 ferredoxin--NADP reductase [Haloechinothrix sp. LS1_15]
MSLEVAREGDRVPVCHQLLVSEVISETADAVSLIFELTSYQEERFGYRPGQFLTLRLPTPDGQLARCYSLSSSPHTDNALKVTVKRVAGGRASNWICDHVTPGTVLDALEPAGIFTPRSLDDDVLLLAAGSGITPVMSIIKSLLTVGTGSIVLCYANRDEASVIFAEELRRLELAHPGRLTVRHWWESVSGTPTEDGIGELIAGDTFSEVFVCGPKPFMNLARRALRANGIDRSRIQIERFASLGGDPFDGAVAAGRHGHAGGTGSSRLDLDTGGQRRTIDWPSDTRLLDLLLAHGVDAPSSCGEGVCASCECRVVEGEVRMVNNQVLDEEDIAEGYVLACQALPATPSVHISLE